MTKHISSKKHCEFEIVPHVGILPLKLGMRREEVRQTMLDMGRYQSSNSRGHVDYYIENCVQITFDLDGEAKFIEISSSAEITVMLKGKDVFRTDAETIFDHIQENFAARRLTYNEYEHLFREPILTLYDADEQYDLWGERFPVWAAIGVGNSAYLKAVDEISRKNSV